MRNVSWAEAIKMCKWLTKKIQDDNYKPDVMIGIARGGLVPLCVLSYMLGIRNVQTIALKLYDKNKKNDKIEQIIPCNIGKLKGCEKVLIVDDVSDTGKTLEYVISKARKKEVRTATLFYKPKSGVKPDYYVEKTEEWINFPWEYENSKS